MVKDKEYNCHFEFALDIVGGKWKLIILHCIRMNKVVRYSEFKKFIPKINERVLSRQLKELEEDGIIEKNICSLVPLKVEYSLSERGKKLIPVLNSLISWGKYYADSIGFNNFRIDISKTID